MKQASAVVLALNAQRATKDMMITALANLKSINYDDPDDRQKAAGFVVEFNKRLDSAKRLTIPEAITVSGIPAQSFPFWDKFSRESTISRLTELFR